MFIITYISFIHVYYYLYFIYTCLLLLIFHLYMFINYLYYIYTCLLLLIFHLYMFIITYITFIHVYYYLYYIYTCLLLFIFHLYMFMRQKNLCTIIFLPVFVVLNDILTSFFFKCRFLLFYIIALFGEFKENGLIF